MNEIKKLLGIHISITETKTDFIKDETSVFKFAENCDISCFALLLPKNIPTIEKQINVKGNVFAHSSFKHNPSSLDMEKLSFSNRLLLKEAEYCQLFNIKHLVFHPGANLFPNDLEKRLESLKNICLFFEMYAKTNINTILLMENSCGAGSQLFYDIKDFEYIFNNLSVEAKEKIGICLDTCHLFQAGYDVSEKDVFVDLVNNFQLISQNKVLLFHLNDSKAELNKHLDRHEKIGFGKIGKNFYSHVKNYALENKIPMILETPKTTLERIEERKNLLSLY